MNYLSVAMSKSRQRTITQSHSSISYAGIEGHVGCFLFLFAMAADLWLSLHGFPAEPRICTWFLKMLGRVGMSSTLWKAVA